MSEKMDIIIWPKNRENILNCFYVILSGHIVDVNYRKNDLFCLIAKQINWRGRGGGGGTETKFKIKKKVIETGSILSKLSTCLSE